MKGFLKSSLVLMIGELLTKVISILYIIPLIRLNYEISELNAFVVIPFATYVIFSTLGLNIILTSEINKNKENKNGLKSVVNTSLVILIVLSLSVSLFVFFNANWIVDNINVDPIYYSYVVMSTKVLTIGIFLFAVTSFLRAILLSYGEFFVISFSYFFEQIFKSLLIIVVTYVLLVNFNYDVGIYALILSCSTVIGLVITLIYYLFVFFKRGYHTIFIDGVFKYSNKLVRKLLVTSIVILSASLYLSLFDQMDLIMVKDLLIGSGESESFIDSVVGIYFTNSWKFIFIPISIAGTFVSVMLNKLGNKLDENKVNFDAMLIIALLFGLVSMVFMFSLSKDIYYIFYNSMDYIIMSLQVILIPFYVFRNMLGTYVVTNNGSYVSIIVNLIITLVLKYVLNIVLFDIFGIFGIILSSVISIFVSSILLILWDKKLFLLDKYSVYNKVKLIVKGFMALFVMIIIKQYVYIDNVIISGVIMFILTCITLGVMYFKEIKDMLYKERL